MKEKHPLDSRGGIQHEPYTRGELGSTKKFQMKQNVGLHLLVLFVAHNGDKSFLIAMKGFSICAERLSNVKLLFSAYCCMFAAADFMSLHL